MVDESGHADSNGRMVKNELSQSTTADPVPLSYRQVSPSSPLSGLAVAALVIALLGSPLLRALVSTRPFWTGHPLAPVARVVDHIPILLTPLLAIALGFLARYQIAHSDGKLRGNDVAWAAIALAVAWIAILVLGFLFIILMVMPLPKQG